MFCQHWHPVLRLVLTRVEFWVYLLLHSILSSLVAANALDSNQETQIPWPVVTCLMLFATLLIFYCYTMCYQRHAELTHAFLGLDEAVRLFMAELTTVPTDPAIRGYVMCAAKYFLAGTHHFYLGLVSGDLTESEWCIIQAKGLLQMEEVLFLKRYPGRTVTLLTSWSLRVVAEMLKNPVATARLGPLVRAGIYSRLNEKVKKFSCTSAVIIDVLESPLPLPCIRLMNVALSFGLGITGYALALSQSFVSTVPYILTLVSYMGIREVSFILADPLRCDGCAIPILSLLNRTFNDSVAILEGSIMYDPVSKVPEATGFLECALSSDCLCTSKAEGPRNLQHWWDSSRPPEEQQQQMLAWLREYQGSQGDSGKDSSDRSETTCQAVEKVRDSRAPSGNGHVLPVNLPQPPEFTRGSKSDPESIDAGSKTVDGLPLLQVVDALDRLLLQFQAVAQRLDDCTGRAECNRVFGSSAWPLPAPQQKVLWPPATTDVFSSPSLANSVIEQQAREAELEVGMGQERIRALQKGSQPCCKVPQCFP